MERHRQIIVEIATSADGFIARPDGDYSWLDRPQPKGNYGLDEFFKSIDTILWGRKTYDIALRAGHLGSFGPNIRNFVFSHHPPAGAAKDVEFVSRPIGQFARDLRAAPGKDIWMMGGGELIASFLDEGEIDEFRIAVIPVFIGEGIPLIAPRHRLVRLKLLGTEPFPDGVVRLNYAVERG